MLDDMRPGDRVQFTVGEGKWAYTGYGRVTQVRNGQVLTEPDQPFPPGIKITDLKKVDR